jgi:hypothetical protein
MSQLAESEAFVQCVRQSVFQLEKQVAKLKQKLKASVANEASATARAHDSECRERDAAALVQSLSGELAALRASNQLATHHASLSHSSESERRVAALECGMQALMHESSTALDSALAIAMREGSARAVMADELQLLRRVSQHAASAVDFEASTLSVVGSSVPALLRHRILFSRQILCKASLCRTQLFGFQQELASLASTWRYTVAAMQRETASAVLAAVAAAHKRAR